jgi:hypothetical protein
VGHRFVNFEFVLTGYSHLNGMGFGVQAAEYIRQGERIFMVPEQA